MVAYDFSITGQRTLNAAVVSLRSTWDESWTAYGYELQCTSVTRAVAPNMPQASLVYHYGWIQEYDETDFTLKLPLAVLGHYVKIVLTTDNDVAPQTVTWYGVVVDIADEQQGTHDQNGSTVEQGTQRITCLGLEWLWTRQQITKSIVAVDSSVSDTYEIARPIIFNGGKGDRLTADDEHRHNKAISQPVFASEVKPSTADVWTAKDILTYIIEWFYPDAFQNATYDFSACGDLDWYTPTIDAEGRSAWEVLTMVCDKRRALGWYIDVESDDTVVFKFFSYADADIVLPSGKIITANPRFFTFNYDQLVDVPIAVIEQNSATRYSQVVARGARRTSTFSLSKTGSTLVNDWTSAMETDYTTASGAGADLAEQIMRNDSYRQTDKLKRVYSWFRMNTSALAYSSQFAFPAVDPISGVVSTTESETVWYPGLRFLSHLLLKTNNDYSSSLPGTDSTDTNAQAEFLRPFGVIKYDGTRYQFLDKLARAGAYNEAYGAAGFSFSCSVRMQDSAPGVVVDCHGCQHLIALNHYNPATAAPSDDDPELDYDTIIFTVSSMADSYAEQSYPDDPDVFIDNSEILYIDLRDRARMDYLVEDTVVGVLDGSLQTATGGWIRDDREYLKDIARAAWQWYSTPRRSLDITLRQIASSAEIGDLISDIGMSGHETEINSVVTQITWNMEQGTTKIQTQFGELDFSGVFA